MPPLTNLSSTWYILIKGTSSLLWSNNSRSAPQRACHPNDTYSAIGRPTEICDNRANWMMVREVVKMVCLTMICVAGYRIRGKYSQVTSTLSALRGGCRNKARLSFYVKPTSGKPDRMTSFIVYGVRSQVLSWLASSYIGYIIRGPGLMRVMLHIYTFIFVPLVFDVKMKTSFNSPWKRANSSIATNMQCAADKQFWKLAWEHFATNKIKSTWLWC